MQDVVSRTDMKRMGVRLGRMGGQRNAGLSEERTQERGMLPILVLKARAHVKYTMNGGGLSVQRELHR